ncbi:MAG: AAA family ATPase [Chitinivibrionales bacterium]|nr:AAA family ATPase [Chitinivibrionales bacterium]MBD3358355.1 AAA family ATPase [Chitinivibrionales bacterium]
MERNSLISTGIDGLDIILRGGLPPKNMYAIQGSSGSGKTTLGLQFLIAGARKGDRCMYIATSEKPAEIDEIARSHGWSLEGVSINRLSFYGDRGTGGRGQTMIAPAEVELPQIIDSIVRLISEYDPQRIVLDSLSEIRLLSRERVWFQRQLMMLKEFLSGRSSTTLLTDTSTEERSELKTVVNGVITMSRTKPLYGPTRRRLEIEKLRGHDFMSGMHDYAVVRGGLKVFPRLVSSEYKKDFSPETVSTGIDEFDSLLGGGLDRGTATLLSGAAGTGKSALVTAIAIAAARRGERSAIYTFDERMATIKSRAKSLGMDLEHRRDEGLLEIVQIDPAELTAGEFSSRVIKEVVEHETSVVAVDSLNGYAYALPDEHFLSVHLHELAAFLGVRGVVTLMTMAQQVGFGLSGGNPPFEVSYVSDTVVNLGYFEYRGTVRKALSVRKRRSGEHDQTIRELIMGSSGIRIGAVLDKFEGISNGIPRYVGECPDPEEECP